MRNAVPRNLQPSTCIDFCDPIEYRGILPAQVAAVQQTIKGKAAGGEIVRIKREDDANGKWNHEVVVKTNGKESGFEVDPNGKFVRQHTEVKR